MDTVPELSDLVFSAKIDYLSLAGLKRKPLPTTVGRVYWPSTHHGARLTIHDPTADDIRRIAAVYPSGQLAELEVAVDVRPRARLSEAEHLSMLARFKAEYVAKGLKPRFTEELNSGFRGTYRRHPTGYSLRPFNLRVPEAGEQMLHGHRNDGVQVKVYLKGIDNRHQLPFQQHRTRMEVRLGTLGLEAHQLMHISNLADFPFRKELMPYFQHVHGSRRRATSKRKQHNSPMLDLLLRCGDDIDARYWDKVGVGAFLHGGRRASNDLLFYRHTAINDRIGQALHRLQAMFTSKQFVCAAQPDHSESSMMARTCVEVSNSAMTYSYGSGSADDLDREFAELVSGLSVVDK